MIKKHCLGLVVSGVFCYVGTSKLVVINSKGGYLYAVMTYNSYEAQPGFITHSLIFVC